MNTKEVSVIIPVYNGEKYIDRCLRRLLRQKDVDFEVLLILNGCTDNSEEKCKQWAKKDSRVRVFKNKEAGTSLARKRGVEEAESIYTVFCDIDDYYVNDYALSNMAKAIVEDGTDICQFGHLVNQYGYCFKKKHFAFEKDIKFRKKELLEGPIIGAVLGRKGIFEGSVWSKIYKTNILKNAVKNIKDALTQQEDLHLNAFVFSDELVQSASCRKEVYYVYNTGTGVSSKKDTMINLLRDYNVIKKDIYSRYKDLDVKEEFFLRLWSETVYCYRAFVFSQLQNKIDEEEILENIKEIERYEYISMAKEYYKQYFGPERNEYIEFICSDYSPEEYLEYCKKTLPKLTAKQKLKKIVKKVLVK